MIRVSHVTLPPGLSALAQRGPDGELAVFVSAALPADRQREAVRAALRATRRTGWRTAMPAPSIALLAAFAAGIFRKASRLLRAHPLGWGTASAVAATTAVAAYLTLVPHAHGPISMPRPATPSASQLPLPSPAPTRAGPRPGGRRHTRGPQAASGPSATPQVAPLTARPPQPIPSPTTPSPPAPSRSPSPVPVPSSPLPTPAPSAHGHCLRLPGIRICLSLSL